MEPEEEIRTKQCSIEPETKPVQEKKYYMVLKKKMPMEETSYNIGNNSTTELAMELSEDSVTFGHTGLNFSKGRGEKTEEKLLNILNHYEPFEVDSESMKEFDRNEEITLEEEDKGREGKYKILEKNVEHEIRDFKQRFKRYLNFCWFLRDFEKVFKRVENEFILFKEELAKKEKFLLEQLTLYYSRMDNEAERLLDSQKSLEMGKENLSNYFQQDSLKEETFSFITGFKQQWDQRIKDFLELFKSNLETKLFDKFEFTNIFTQPNKPDRESLSPYTLTLTEKIEEKNSSRRVSPKKYRPLLSGIVLKENS